MALRGRKKTGAFKSNLNAINNQIRKGILKNQSKAAKMYVKELKAVVGNVADEGDYSPKGSPPNKLTGDLQKGIGFAHDRHAQDIETQVGFHRPAYHAHLMEFGTDARYQKSYKKKPLKKLKFVGHVAPRPFFVKTMMKHLDRAKQLLSEPVL